MVADGFAEHNDYRDVYDLSIGNVMACFESCWITSIRNEEIGAEHDDRDFCISWLLTSTLYDQWQVFWYHGKQTVGPFDSLESVDGCPPMDLSLLLPWRRSPKAGAVSQGRCVVGHESAEASPRWIQRSIITELKIMRTLSKDASRFAPLKTKLKRDTISLQ